MKDKEDALKEVLSKGPRRCQIKRIVFQTLQSSNVALTREEVHLELTSKGYSATMSSTREALYRLYEEGKIIVLTTHGKPRVAMVDIDLLEEFVENTEYGISKKEIHKRAKEKTVSLSELKQMFNV